MRGATEATRPASLVRSNISILAPRAGSDEYVALGEIAGKDFNPRSPCGERPLPTTASCSNFGISILAPRAGSDPSRASGCIDIGKFQSSLPVRGATDPNSHHPCTIQHFNPRSPCGERPVSWRRCRTTQTFQSSLPVRGATWLPPACAHPIPISILAPRAGSDGTAAAGKAAGKHFNPRSPCGERPAHGLSLGRLRRISILAPRAGSDGLERRGFDTD